MSLLAEVSNSKGMSTICSQAAEAVCVFGNSSSESQCHASYDDVSETEPFYE